MSKLSKFFDDISGKTARNMAQAEADRARAEEEARNARIEASVRRLNELFGLGDTQEARQARERIAQQGQAEARSLGNEQLDQLRQAFVLARQNQRLAQANAGTIGGSTDARLRREANKGYVQGRQSIDANMQRLRLAHKNAIEARRAGLESQVRSDVLQPGADLALSSQASELAQARANIPGVTLDRLLNTGAAVVQQNNEAKASGRPGLKLFGGG